MPVSSAALDVARLPGKRRLVFVVGSGRSGTSTMAGALQALGMHVPQPEVSADETNPKGTGEPQWVVDCHTELLARANVAVSDARPAAWFEAGKLAHDEELRERLYEWLAGQFEVAPELVVKDPRLAWFMGLWRSAALRCDAAPAYVTMLRPVTEVAGSKQRYHAARSDEITRTAAWVNMMLHTERSTRGSTRVFIRYADLLSDWTIPLAAVGQRLDLDTVNSASANKGRAVHSFIDPGLRRVQLTWDDFEVPTRLREIAEESWQGLDRLADPDGDTPETHDLLDELRAAYADYYSEAEAVAASSASAAHRVGTSGGGTKGQAGSVGRSGSGVSVNRRVVDRIPHGVRAMVPESTRRNLRRALGRER